MKGMRQLKHWQNHGKYNINLSKKNGKSGGLSIPQILDKSLINQPIYNLSIIVYWKNYLFHISPNHAQKRCIEEKAKLMNKWLQVLPVNDITFKAIMVILSPLLQKRWKFSKSKYHLKSLPRPIKLCE